MHLRFRTWALVVGVVSLHWLMVNSASAAILTTRANFETASSAAGLTLTTDAFANPFDASTTGTALMTNAAGVYALNPGGLTRIGNGVRYVGTQAIPASSVAPYDPLLFLSPNETYFYRVSPSIYSIDESDGTGTLFGGRTSVDVYLPSGTRAFGTDFAFDRGVSANNTVTSFNGQRSYWSPVAPNDETMRITFLFGNHTTETQSVHLDDMKQFVGFVGTEEITSVRFESLLPALNPNYRSFNSTGYFAYTLLDNVSINTADTAAVPEPASLVIWGLACLGCGFVAYRRRNRAA